MSLYEIESNDWYLHKGDTLVMQYELFKRGNKEVININSWDISFSVIDNNTDAIIITKSLTNGIYKVSSVIPVEYQNILTENNQFMIILTPTDTSLLETKTYLFDIQFTVTAPTNDLINTIIGNLIVKKEVTASV